MNEAETISSDESEKASIEVNGMFKALPGIKNSIRINANRFSNLKQNNLFESICFLITKKAFIKNRWDEEMRR